LSGPEKKAKENEAAEALNSLKEMLLSSLQMQNVSVLAGCGTSLSETINGPSMADLWNEIKQINVKDKSGKVIAEFSKIQEQVKYKITEGLPPNVEELLSRCQAYLQVIENDPIIESFVKQANDKILQKCSFVCSTTDLSIHQTFLHRLSRRRIRDSRLKIFTTNYDLCFEQAAAKNGSVVIDGFSFSQPRIYDPRYFSYDIVRRPRTGEDLGNYLEGVIQLYKLHGSVNWERTKTGEIFEKQNPAPERACIIYPTSGKYQQSYIQPHLELVAHYLSTLRESNTCLLIVGFGFNDVHLSEPILSAVKTNPHLRLIISDVNAEQILDTLNINHAWDELAKLSRDGEDIWFINADFSQLSKLLPDLRSLTKAERLAKNIQAIVGGHE
jgi:cell fate (sporulation/competence/biofilm development) regulator YlbF (YheA/YmcA/DUF963 family)